jgi:hypothetical protein
MKNIGFLIIMLLFIGLSSCKVLEVPRPHRPFNASAPGATTHFGIRLKKNDVQSRYWSVHRYGYRPHASRGKYR